MEEYLLTSAFDDQLKLVTNSLDKNDNKKPMFTNKSRKYRYDENSEGQAKTAQSTGVGETIYQSSKNIKQKQSPKPKSANKSLKDDEGARVSGDCLLVPPPVDIADLPSIENEDQARASMLMSWYMAGYHTGYFEAMRKLKK